MEIKEVKFTFTDNLTLRSWTKYIVIHHTATTSDLTVEDIHKIHLNEKYVGIGYHYFINKNGIVFTGRPEKYIGAHAYPVNTISLGICLSGNFQIEKPTEKQINSLIEILKLMKSKYPNAKIISHSEVIKTEECIKESERSRNKLSYYATECCGKNLFAILPEIINSNSKSEKEKIKLWIQNGKARAVINGKWYGCNIDKNINIGELHLISEE